MRIFFDTNILLDIGLRREPHYTMSQAILADGVRHHQCFLSWHTISNLAYIMERLESKETAQLFIEEITKVCRIAPIVHEDLAVAFKHCDRDLEDAMQIASALAVSADTIVTRDSSGFTKSPIPLTVPEPPPT